MPPKRRKTKKPDPWLKKVPVETLGLGTTFLDLPVEVRFMIYGLANDNLHKKTDKPRCLSSWKPSSLLLSHPTIAYEVLSQYNKFWFTLNEHFLQPGYLRNTIEKIDKHAFGNDAKRFLAADWVPQIKQLRLSAPGLCNIKIKCSAGVIDISNDKVVVPKGTAHDIDRWEHLVDKKLDHLKAHKAFKSKLKEQLQTSIHERKGYGLDLAEMRMVICAVKVFHHEMEVQFEKVKTAAQDEVNQISFLENWLTGITQKQDEKAKVDEVDHHRADMRKLSLNKQHPLPNQQPLVPNQSHLAQQQALSVDNMQPPNANHQNTGAIDLLKASDVHQGPNNPNRPRQGPKYGLSGPVKQRSGNNKQVIDLTGN